MNDQSLLAVLLILFVAACAPSAQKADLIVSGKIYTSLDDRPVVGAVAVAGDRIIFAGSEADAARFAGESTKRIALGEKIMTPGFIDGHAHMMGIGYQEMNLNLDDVKNYDELVEKVRDAAAKTPPGTWIVGRGWHQEKWDKVPPAIVKGFQTHHLLSEATPDHPVYLTHASGHAAFANRKAMEIAGLSALGVEKTPMADGEGGEVIRDVNGNPTGIFIERAMSLISKHIPENDAAADEKALTLAIEACLRNGLTGIHDAGAGRRQIELYRKFRDAGRLAVRMNVMLNGSDRALLREWFAKGPEIDSGHLLTIRSVKLYADGALGSRGAWLLEPYADRPETSGMATMSMDTVLKVARDGLKYGFQICTHAIGDRANREVLNKYEQAIREFPDRAADHRFRIEHAQHIDPADIPRFAQLGVIPAMQAIHMASDRPWAINRLGAKRITEGAYVWQSLLRKGARIVNGTDAPVEPLNPIACFYAAVARKTLEGNPPGGYEPREKLTRQQALKSYTSDAAYGEFAEDMKGSVEPGKLADFTIFSGDIMSMPEDDILDVRVEMTIVGGKVRFERQ